MQDNTKLCFTRTDEWIDFIDEGIAYIGISGFASECCQKCQSLDAPETGKELKRGEILASVHCSGSDGDIRAPFDCRVLEVNMDVLENPNLLLENPYQNWVAKLAHQADAASLLSYEEYMKAVKYA